MVTDATKLRARRVYCLHCRNDHTNTPTENCPALVRSSFRRYREVPNGLLELRDKDNYAYVNSLRQIKPRKMLVCYQREGFHYVSGERLVGY